MRTELGMVVRHKFRHVLGKVLEDHPGILIQVTGDATPYQYDSSEEVWEDWEKPNG